MRNRYLQLDSASPLRWLPVAAFVLGVSQGQLLAAETQSTSGSSLGEIVVTATKREEALINVPIAIQVYGAETLEQLGIDDFEGYARYAPGVSFTKRGAGQTHVVVRGLSTGNVANNQPQNRALVGIYLDDVPIQLNGYNFDPDLFDIERVEVLKGPQGTLFGDSAMAGAIRYVTVRPDLTEWSARIKLSTSTTEKGGENYGVRGMVNLPLSEHLGLRASGYYRDESGWIDNVRLGEEDINSEEIYGGRLSALYEPSEILSIQATVGSQRSRLGGRAQADGPTEPTGFEQDRDRERTYEEALLANLTVTADLPAGTLTSVTGYINRDFNSYEALFIDRLFVLFFGENLPNNTLYYPWKQDFRTQEFRFNSTIGERAEYTVGAFLARQQINYPTY